VDVLLLHSAIADSRMWAPHLEALGADHDVLAPDLPGYGETPLEPGEIAYVEHAAGLLGRPAAVVGSSFGAKIAIELAIDRPDLVERLVVIGAPPLPGTEWSEAAQAGFAEEEEALERGDLDTAAEANVRMWIDGPRRAPGEVDPAVRELVREMTLRSFELQIPLEDQVSARWIDPPANGRLGEIAAPTLVVVGDEDVADILETADVLVREIPAARKAVIEGAGHLPGLERPDELNRLLLDFLRG